MKGLLKRHSQLIKEIGHQRLLELPPEVKKILKSTGHLETKVSILEKIAAEIRKEEK